MDLGPTAALLEVLAKIIGAFVVASRELRAWLRLGKPRC
jgi:hypothetical protein